MIENYWLIGGIYEKETQELIKFVNQLSATVTTLNLYISSPGGSVSHCITLYNFLKLKQDKLEIHTHNIGEVSSAAVLVYLAGEIRTCDNIAKFLLHPITRNVSGKLYYHQMMEYIDDFRVDIRNYVDILRRETNSLKGKYNADLDILLERDSLVFCSKDAYQYGLITNP